MNFLKEHHFLLGFKLFPFKDFWRIILKIFGTTKLNTSLKAKHFFPITQMFKFKKCIFTSTYQIYNNHCDMLKTTYVKSMPRSTIHIFMAWIANFNQMKSDICVKPKIILWHFEWCIFCEGMRLREEMEEMLKGVGGMSSGEGGDILTNNFIVCILLVNVSLFWLITGLTRQYKKYIFWIRFGLANEINNY